MAMGAGYSQDDGAGTPLKRSFIHLMAAGAASRAMKICVTPGSSTQFTLTPWEHKSLANRLVTCGSTVVSALPWAMNTGAPAGAWRLDDKARSASRVDMRQRSIARNLLV